MTTFDPTIVPFLVPISLDSSYDVPSSVVLTTNPTVSNYEFVYTGPGGTFNMIPTGQIASLIGLSGFGLMVKLPGTNGFITRQIAAGNGITVTNSDGTTGDITIAATPNTSLQWHAAQVNGSSVGPARSTINFVPGSGISIVGSDTGTVNTVTISSTGAGADVNAHYVLTESDSNLPNSFSLGGLSSGILKQSVSGIVATPAIAIGNTDYMEVNQNMLDFYNLTATDDSLVVFTGGHFISEAAGSVGQVYGVTAPNTLGWLNVGAGAPFAAFYVVTQSNPDLVNEVNLGALSTGLVLSTVSSGISTITTVPESTFGIIAGTNNWTGTNTFNTNLPTSTVTPTTGSQLITKTYGDTTYGILTAANVWSGAANTFNANPNFPTGATVNYVATCTNATTGAWTWQAIPSQTLSASVVTSNATPTTLISIAIPSNECATLHGYINARNVGATDFTGGEFVVTAGNASGTVSIINTPFIILNASSTTTFNAVVSGTNLIIQVTGLSSTTYNWNAVYTVQIN